MNDRSSRSHQILTVIVDGTHVATGAKTHGCLHLVDLAGSERVDRSGATGGRGCRGGSTVLGGGRRRFCTGSAPCGPG